MKTVKWLIILFIIFVVSAMGTLIVVYATGYRQDYKDFRETIDFQDTRSIRDITAIEVRLNVGRVNIIPSDEEHLSLSFTGEHYALFKKKKVFSIDVKEEDHTLFIHAEVNNYYLIGLMQSTENVVLNVWLPRVYEHDLSLNVSVGDIYVQDLTLDQLRINGSTGAVNLKNLTLNRGVIKLSTGDIEASLLGGDIDVSLNTGDVDLIHLGDAFDVDVFLRTGSVEVILSPEAKFDLQAEIRTGDISSKFPVTQTEKGRNKLIGYVRESGWNRVKIEVRTGSIEIEPKA